LLIGRAKLDGLRYRAISVTGKTVAIVAREQTWGENKAEHRSERDGSFRLNAYAAAEPDAIHGDVSA
jgi:hypothetical protein